MSQLTEEQIVNQVMKSLRGIFPAWRNSIKTQEELNQVKSEWLIAFKENGINTSEHLEQGLRMARRCTTPYIPSVGLFIEWCQLPEPKKFIPEPWQRLGYKSEEEYDEVTRIRKLESMGVNVERMAANG